MSLRGAINAFCRHCLYSPDEPGRWREQTTACTSYKCPLYAVRPTTKGGKTATLEPQIAEIGASEEELAA